MDNSFRVQTTQMHVDPNVIDLGVGQPQLDLLPLQRIRKAAEMRFAQNNPDFLQYGAEPGDGYLRNALASLLSKGYGFPVDMDTIFITNGASLGLDLICTLYTRPGDLVFVEEPSYFLALRIFADHHLQPVAIPVDEDGLMIEALEAALEKMHPALLYTVPTFQNPSGCTLSQERRQRLASLSLQHDFMIIADEVYHFLNYTRQPPTALAGFASQGNIFSLGSFSKILAPGLRLGWIQTAAPRVKALASCGLLDSGGGMNPFTSAIVRGLLETGELEANIEELRTVYGHRLAVLDAALHTELPDSHFQTPQGGFFIWLRLPGRLNAREFLPRAEAFRVSYKPGEAFSSRGKLHDYVRLCFAFYEAEKLAEGVNRLKKALDSQEI